MQRIHITLGHCFQSTPDGYPLRASTLMQVPAENCFPLGWHALAAPLVGKPCPKHGWTLHVRVKVSQKDKVRKTACGSLLLYFKVNKNCLRHQDTKSARLKGKSLPLPLPPFMGLLAHGSHPSWGSDGKVGSRKKLEAPKMSSSLVSKGKFYLEMKLAAWLGITYSWKAPSRSAWGGSQVPARVKSPQEAAAPVGLAPKKQL